MISPAADLIAHIARFSGELREAGIAVALGDEIDAAHSLAQVDLGDRDDVRLALRTSLKVEHRAWPMFDHIFDLSWHPDGPARARSEARKPRRQRAPRPWPGHGNPLAEVARTIAEHGRVGP